MIVDKFSGGDIVVGVGRPGANLLNANSASKVWKDGAVGYRACGYIARDGNACHSEVPRLHAGSRVGIRLVVAEGGFAAVQFYVDGQKQGEEQLLSTGNAAFVPMVSLQYHTDQVTLDGNKGPLDVPGERRDFSLLFRLLVIVFSPTLSFLLR